MKNKTLLIMIFIATLLIGLTGLGLILVNSSVPVLLTLVIAVIYTGLVSAFAAFPRKENAAEAKQEADNKLMLPIEDELKVISYEAEKSLSAINDIKGELHELNQYLNQPTIVASKLSNKFHQPECRFARNISKKNQVWFRSKIDAAKHGFKKCHLMWELCRLRNI